MKKVLVFCISLLTFHFHTHAENYFIKSEADLKNVIPKLIPGDVVTIANGNYQGWSVDITTKGTASKPILIQAETPKGVIFSGEVNLVLFKITGHYITLTGMVFNNCSLNKKEGKSGVLIELKDAVNCKISNCSFVKNQSKAQFMPLVVISGNGFANTVAECLFESNIDSQDVQVKITKESCPQRTLIHQNIFQNKKKVSWQNGNGGECIQIGQDPVLLGTIEANTIVSKNTFISCNGENEIISNKSSKNSYLNNVFSANDGELVMRGGHDCIIDQNIFDRGTGGIRLNGTGHSVTNNKLNHIKTAIRLMYGMAKGKETIGFYITASNCTIKNNVITNATTGILVGDSKDADWTGKFDIKRYPSPVIQNIAPFDNQIEGNKISSTVHPITNN